MIKLNCYIKQPGQKPYHTYVSNSLEALQKAVGGYIEAVTLPNGTVAICDEEGRFKGLGYSCELYGAAFYGTVIFLGVKGEHFADHPAQTLREFEHTTEIYY